MPTGKIAAFDRDRGRGEIEGAAGRFRFHATRVANGSRTVAVGTEVEFEVTPGHLGEWEAVNLRPVTNRSAEPRPVHH